MNASAAGGDWTSPELSWERLMLQTRYGRYANQVESMMVEHVLTRYLTPGVLLDVGCEGGRWSKVFAERGWQVIATDLDERSLRICQSRIPNVRCVLVEPDCKQLPVENESIDLLLCVEVGPVIHTDWAVREFARVLKPGGKLVGVCWNRTSWRGFLYHRIAFVRSAGSHPMWGYPIRYEHFRRQMKVLGFRFEKELGYAWGPFRRTSNSPMVSIWSLFERLSGLQHFISWAPMVAFVAEREAPSSLHTLAAL